MGINIGNLSVAKKVKRVYVGVDGVARRVKKVYAGAQDMAKIVYEDDALLQTPVTFNMGNMSPILCTAVLDPETNEYIFTGTFKDKFTLSEIRADSTTGVVTDTGRSISLGSATKPYNMPMQVAPYGSAYADDARFFFGGSSVGNIYVKRIRPVGMVDDIGSESGSSLWTIKNTNYQTLVSGPQDIEIDLATSIVWPSKGTKHKFVNMSSSGIIVTNTLTGGDNPSTETAILSGYNGPQNAIRTQGYEFYRKALVTGSATGNVPKLISIFFDDNLSDAFYVRSTYEPSLPSGFVTTNLFLGAAHVGSAKTSAGGTFMSSYMTTMSYQDGEKRYCKLMVDSGKYEFNMSNYTDDIKFDVREYTESCDLPADSNLAALYKWHILGSYDNEVFVLSTMGETVKVIRFSTETGQLVKVKEYDTGIEVNASTVVHQPVPVIYAPYSTAESSGRAFLTAFVVTRNNEYNEIVVVPRSLLQEE